MNDDDLRKQRNARSGRRTGWTMFGVGLGLAAEKALMLAAGMGVTPFPWWMIGVALITGLAMALTNEGAA